MAYAAKERRAGDTAFRNRDLNGGGHEILYEALLLSRDACIPARFDNDS